MFPSVLDATAAPKEKGKDVYYARLEKASERVSDAEVRRTINDYTCSPCGDSGQMEADDGSNYRKVQLCMYGTTALFAFVDPRRENLWSRALVTVKLVNTFQPTASSFLSAKAFFHCHSPRNVCSICFWNTSMECRNAHARSQHIRPNNIQGKGTASAPVDGSLGPSRLSELCC